MHNKINPHLLAQTKWRLQLWNGFVRIALLYLNKWRCHYSDLCARFRLCKGTLRTNQLVIFPTLYGLSYKTKNSFSVKLQIWIKLNFYSCANDSTVVCHCCADVTHIFYMALVMCLFVHVVLCLVAFSDQKWTAHTVTHLLNFLLQLPHINRVQNTR